MNNIAKAVCLEWTEGVGEDRLCISDISDLSGVQVRRSVRLHLHQDGSGTGTAESYSRMLLLPSDPFSFYLLGIRGSLGVHLMHIPVDCLHGITYLINFNCPVQ